jgi:hypothetical protein
MFVCMYVGRYARKYVLALISTVGASTSHKDMGRLYFYLIS